MILDSKVTLLYVVPLRRARLKTGDDILLDRQHFSATIDMFLFYFFRYIYSYITASAVTAAVTAVSNNSNLPSTTANTVIRNNSISL